MKHIYICTPSAPYMGSVHTGIQALESVGYTVTLSKNACTYNGNTSDSIANRVADLEDGFSNSDYDMVLAMRGGWNSNEILPYIDYDLIAQHPKPFVGMSDMTTLCTNLFQRSAIPTIYGPNLSRIAKNPQLANYFSDIASVRNLFPEPIRKEQVYRRGTMKGRLFGGNLAVLCWLTGTEYALQIPQGSVLFLEDDEETNGYYWQMYLTHLKQAHYFDNISGLILGTISPGTNFNDRSSIRDILDAVIGEYDFPVVIEASFGHIHTLVPIPIGAEYELSV